MNIWSFEYFLQAFRINTSQSQFSFSVQYSLFYIPSHSKSFSSLMWGTDGYLSCTIIVQRNVFGYDCKHGSLRRERLAASDDSAMGNPSAWLCLKHVCNYSNPDWCCITLWRMTAYSRSYKVYPEQSSISFWLAEASYSQACRMYGRVTQRSQETMITVVTRDVPFWGNSTLLDDDSVGNKIPIVPYWQMPVLVWNFLGTT